MNTPDLRVHPSEELASTPPQTPEAPDAHARNLVLHGEYRRLLQEAEDARWSGDDLQRARLETQAERVAVRFVTHNRRLAHRVVNSFALGDRSLREELDAAAQEVLTSSFLSWDPQKGTFSTYVTRAILGAVARTVRIMEFDHLSYADFCARPVVRDAVEHLSTQAHRPSHEEVVSYLANRDVEITPTLVERARTRRAVSLFELSDTYRAEIVEALLEDAQIARERLARETFDATARIEFIRRCCEGLDPTVYHIVFAVLEGQTLVQVGADIGMGRETVRRRYHCGLDHVRARALEILQGEPELAALFA